MSKNINNLGSTIFLFYIGDSFYYRSRTFMSPIYEEKTFERYDWWEIQTKLSEGFTVKIRPCNDEEMEWAKYKLLKINLNK